MDDDVPLSIIRPKFNRVPPIRVETSVGKSSYLRPKVEPTMQKPEESQNKEKRRWKHQLYHSKYES